MALIQNLAQGQEELIALVNQIHQDGCNRMKQIVKIRDQVTTQSPMRQETGSGENRPFRITATSQTQQRPCQHQQENR